MSELVEFLRARLDEDEASAQRAGAATVDMDEPLTVIEADESTFLAINPSRMLAEVDAKRQIVDLHSADGHECIEGVDAQGAVLDVFTSEHPCPTLRLLALPYADDPGYREEWRP